MKTALIGIDEVGRGPIAGPVAVCSFFYPKNLDIFKGIKESKQLSEKKREDWFCIIEKAKENGLIDFSVNFQSHKVIDSKGLSFAIKKAIQLSIDGLGANPLNVSVLLDGGLKAPDRYINQKTIIGGDGKEIVIALASVCAKVIRDRYMRNISKKYPQYGFDLNKGYGTKKHYESIKINGLSPLHRTSFFDTITRTNV